MPKIVKGK